MKPHSQQMMRHFQFASVIMEYKSLRTHEDSEGLESLPLPAEVPQFLLLGNQSSGKTTILQRMTKLPLGVTGTTQGTCRPFQFTLIHDPNEDGHVIHVDGQEVARENLLEKLTAKNAENGGRFDSRRVSVTVWSKHVTSLIIVDMPGLSMQSREPLEMALKELEEENAIPILVLQSSDPRSAEPARQAFETLLDGRRTQAVAIMNKFDEKILEPGSELGNGTKWNQWVESWNRQAAEQIGRYSAWFMVGVPPGDPNEDLVTRLKGSGKKEAQLIEKWKKRCGAEALWPEQIKFGLSSFEEFVHSQQSERLSNFVNTVGPRLSELQSSEQELLPPKLQGGSELLQKMAYIVTEGQSIWEGKLESGQFSEDAKKNLPQELHWLKEQNMGQRAKTIIEMLDSGDWQQAVGRRIESVVAPYADGQTAADTSAEGSADDGASRCRREVLQSWMVKGVHASDTHLLGLTATKRFADCIERFAFGLLWLHTAKHYTLEFFRNSVSDQQEQSANNAIKEYKKSMCARIFRPLAELMRIMLEEQFVRSMDAPFDSNQRDQKQWFSALQDEGLEVDKVRERFRREVKKIAQVCGKEFGRMMENDIETLESELFHSFSDDESAEFIRRNSVLGDCAKIERRGGGKHQYSPEALARRFLAVFVTQVKETSAFHMTALREQAENALQNSTITMPVEAGSHEVADYLHPIDGVSPHVIKEPGYKCISSAPTWNQLFAGPTASDKTGFRGLHLVSPRINAALYCQVDLEIFGHTEVNFFNNIYHDLPKSKKDLEEKNGKYCDCCVVLQNETTGELIQHEKAKKEWTEVSLKLPAPKSGQEEFYIVHILDFRPRGIACRRMTSQKRHEKQQPDPAVDSSSVANGWQQEASQHGDAEAGGALAKMMYSGVTLQVGSHPQTHHEETMFHDLYSRITLEMISTLKQFDLDLQKNINKFRELSHGQAPYFMEGLGLSVKGMELKQEEENRLKIARICRRLTLIERARALFENGARGGA